LTVAPGDSAAADSAGQRSDAVAVQIPFKLPEGNAKPYFLFGDKKNPVEIWFCDLARADAQTLVGKGRGSLEPSGSLIEAHAAYAEGEWSVIYLRPRRPAKGLPLEGGAFVPISFSVWDGFNGETGDRRGVTSWYTLYLNPPSAGKPYLPAAAKALAVLAAEAIIVFWARRRARKGGRA
jgi:DMSO reductase family type II enzyme heme b subunit